MGMLAYLRSVTIEELEEISQADRESVHNLLWSDDEFLGHYFELGAAWAGLEFLITGRSFAEPKPTVENPLDWVIFGKHSVGSEDHPLPCSWIGIRYLLVEEVKQVSAALASLPEQTLRDRYAPQTMDKKMVYPSNPEAPYWEKSSAEELDWLMNGYPDLVAFYQQASTEGKAMITYMPY